jgi:hypothetical protein
LPAHEKLIWQYLILFPLFSTAKRKPYAIFKFMRLTTSITVAQSIDEAFAYLANPHNSNKWDKSIQTVDLPGGTFSGVGTVVNTVAPSGMKQSFVVTEFSPPDSFKFRLLKSPMFKLAELSFVFEVIEGKTKITHIIELKLHFWALFLYPVLMLTNKKALGTDMEALRKGLDEFVKPGTTR